MFRPMMTLGPQIPEVRCDAVRGSWVVVAPARAGRPHDFDANKDRPAAPCPFCEGNEALTTSEVAVTRPGGGASNSPGWTARAVTNLYPAFRMDASSLAAAASTGAVRSAQPGEGPGAAHHFSCDAGLGRHEVLIETPVHEAHPADFSDDHMAMVLRLLRGRVDALRRDQEIAHVIAFKNHGLGSGASLRHPHQQIVAMPATVPLRARHARVDAAYHAAHGRFPLDDQVRAEELAEVRIVQTSARFVAFVPHASRFSGEVTIAARSAVGPFHSLQDEVIVEFGALVQASLRRVRRAFGDPDFNWLLHAFDRERDALGAPWRFDIVPRMAALGGFELSTGATIISLPPEDAAARLRGGERAAGGGTAW